MDIFQTKGIEPMLIAEMQDAFDSDEYIFEIKLDGIRCLAYLDNKTELINKRSKKLLPHVPELKNLHQYVNEKCILDGELYIMKNGTVDFNEIQRRSLLSDPFKIRLAGKSYPASFNAYDILYYKDKLVNELTLMERKKLLQNVVIKEDDRFSISRYIEGEGIHLYKLAEEKKLEGIVAKKKSSKYWFGKRTKEWVKCKVMDSDDFVVAGYIKKTGNMVSFVIGQYDNDELIYVGHVTLGASLKQLESRSFDIVDASPFKCLPGGNEDAVWIYPHQVCIVEWMKNDKGSFRQTVCKGIRDDKLTEECTVVSSG